MSDDPRFVALRHRVEHCGDSLRQVADRVGLSHNVAKAYADRSGFASRWQQAGPHLSLSKWLRIDAIARLRRTGCPAAQARAAMAAA
eukprot:gene6227-837_t